VYEKGERVGERKKKKLGHRLFNPVFQRQWRLSEKKEKGEKKRGENEHFGGARWFNLTAEKTGS